MKQWYSRLRVDMKKNSPTNFSVTFAFNKMSECHVEVAHDRVLVNSVKVDDPVRFMETLPYFPITWNREMKRSFIQWLIQPEEESSINLPELEKNLLFNGFYNIRIPLEFGRYADESVYPSHLVKFINPKIIPHTAETREEVKDLASEDDDGVPELSYRELVNRHGVDMKAALELYGFEVPLGIHQEELYKLYIDKLPNYIYRYHDIFDKDGVKLGNRNDLDELQRTKKPESKAVNGYVRVLIGDRDWLVATESIGSHHMHTNYEFVPHNEESSKDARSRPSVTRLHRKTRADNQDELTSLYHENISTIRNEQYGMYNIWLKNFKSQDEQYNQMLKRFNQQPVRYLTNRELRGSFTEYEKELFINGVAYVEYRIPGRMNNTRRSYVDVRDLPLITIPYRIMPIETPSMRAMEIITGDIVPDLTTTGPLFE